MCGAEPQAEHPSERSERHDALVSTCLTCFRDVCCHDLTRFKGFCFFTKSYRSYTAWGCDFFVPLFSMLLPPSGGVILVRCWYFQWPGSITAFRRHWKPNAFFKANLIDKSSIILSSLLVLTPAVSGRAKRGPASLLAMLDGLVRYFTFHLISQYR